MQESICISAAESEIDHELGGQKMELSELQTNTLVLNALRYLDNLVCQVSLSTFHFYLNSCLIFEFIDNSTEE